MFKTNNANSFVSPLKKVHVHQAAEQKPTVLISSVLLQHFSLKQRSNLCSDNDRLEPSQHLKIKTRKHLTFLL